MPVYDYACPKCGPFEAMAPMAAHTAPSACPDCAAPSPRALINVPRLSRMAGERRAAFATNERSADAPKRLSTHGPGCGCCSGQGKRASRTVLRPDGSKSLAGTRPWMISH